MTLRAGMFDDDMLAVLDDLGEDVTIGGGVLKAVVGEISEGVSLMLEGYLPDVTASFTFRRTDFNGVLPAAQSTLVYDGITYRVLVPVKTPQGGSIVLECGAETA